MKRQGLSRREWLQRTGGGFGWLAAQALLQRDAGGTHRPPAVDHAATAKAVIQIFCPGGMSQIDTFDYNPELVKRSGL